MRIISGKMKGSRLYLTNNQNTRPLKDLVRESIFNLLEHSKKILFKFEKSNILDLYAGTGSFGLECISRNSKRVFFVENEKETIKTLEKNLKKLKIKDKAQIFFGDAFNFLEKKNINKEKFNLIFCDPPYKTKDMQKLIELIFYCNLLDKNGIVILHRNKSTKERFPNYFEIVEERVYGISKIIFGKFLS